jgi:type IV pilus biogenesis protein PilP
VAFYGDEAGLQRQLRLLSLRAEIAALKKKLGEDEAGPGATAASPVAVLPPPMVAQGSTDAHDPSASGTVASITLPPPGRTDARSVGGLQLVSVLGVAGDYQAVVSVGAGQMPVRVGAQLSDGWTVVSIGPTSVSLAKGRQRKTLVIGG